jgi:hypothetical protein
MSLDILRQLLPRGGDKKVLSLGYPDILVDVQDIAKLFGSDILQRLDYHPDSEKIIRWHGIQRITNKIVEAHSFFAALGYELEVVDIVAARGDEILLNLNEPCPESLFQKYYLVIDGGTCEHCFNIAQAMKNLAMMVEVGGHVVQGNPLNYPNHGFYNLSPTFYYDFYLSNGFEMRFFKVVNDPVHSPKLFDVSAYDRKGFDDIPARSSNFVVARRMQVQDIVWPIQKKYKINPNLHG